MTLGLYPGGLMTPLLLLLFLVVVLTGLFGVIKKWLEPVSSLIGRL